MESPPRGGGAPRAAPRRAGGRRESSRVCGAARPRSAALPCSWRGFRSRERGAFSNVRAIASRTCAPSCAREGRSGLSLRTGGLSGRPVRSGRSLRTGGLSDRPVRSERSRRTGASAPSALSGRSATRTGLPARSGRAARSDRSPPSRHPPAAAGGAFDVRRRSCEGRGARPLGAAAAAAGKVGIFFGTPYSLRSDNSSSRDR